MVICVWLQCADVDLQDQQSNNVLWLDRLLVEQGFLVLCSVGVLSDVWFAAAHCWRRPGWRILEISLTAAVADTALSTGKGALLAPSAVEHHHQTLSCTEKMCSLPFLMLHHAWAGCVWASTTACAKSSYSLATGLSSQSSQYVTTRTARAISKPQSSDHMQVINMAACRFSPGPSDSLSLSIAALADRLYRTTQGVTAFMASSADPHSGDLDCGACSTSLAMWFGIDRF